ncbi:MAG: PilZ domain-containing protein, partial [Acidobacteria bacterium]|nr:PilZ domain-containing protein [Acidobacteriota bacterium]
KSGLQDPSSIMKFSHVFENSLDKYYEREKIESISMEMLVQISILRKELGFSPLPRGIALSSTRQVCSGDKCIVQIPESDPPMHDGICYVLDSEERQWSITRPDCPPVQAGTWVNINLTKPGDAEYTFKTQVLEDLSEELVLRHTSKLNRTQQRNWLRIDVDIPVSVTLMEEPNIGDILSGKIIDISGGGLGMTLAVKLPKNTMLLLSFELPGRDKIIDLPVKVVRVAGPLGGSSSKVVHSVSFECETDLACEKIIQYVFEKQRENLLIRQA